MTNFNPAILTRIDGDQGFSNNTDPEIISKWATI